MTLEKALHIINNTEPVDILQCRDIDEVDLFIVAAQFLAAYVESII